MKRWQRDEPHSTGSRRPPGFAGIGLVEWADVAGVRREAAKRARVTAEREQNTADDRFLVLQPNLDEVLVEAVGWPRRPFRISGRQSVV